MTVCRITLSPLAMTSIRAVSPGARRPSLPGRQGFVIPSRFDPAEGFPAGTRDLEFSKNRGSRDASGTSGGDSDHDRISYVLSQGGGASPVAWRRRSPRREFMVSGYYPFLRPRVIESAGEPRGYRNGGISQGLEFFSETSGLKPPESASSTATEVAWLPRAPARFSLRSQSCRCAAPGTS